MHDRTGLNYFTVDATSVYVPNFVVLRTQPWSNVLYNESTSVYNDASRLTQITLLCISCRNHHPMLLAQWQQGVTRSDLAKEFSFEEFIKVCLMHFLECLPES